MCRWGVALALAVLLTSQIALAERVAVSTLEGDKNYRLRGQVTAALRKTRKVQVLPPAAYGMAAAKLRLRGPAAVSPEAVLRLSTKLKLDAVLTGSVGTTFKARLMAWDGREIWAGEYPLKRGLLPPKEAQKLAQAVAVAVKAANQPAPVSAPEPVAQPTPEPTVRPPPESQAVAQAEPEAVEPPQKEEPESPPSEVAAAPVPERKPALEPRAPEANPRPEAKPEPVPAWVELDEESHTYTSELPGSAGGFPEAQGTEGQGASAERRTPPRVRVLLGAAVTWRKYCARPGVASCAEFDARLPEQQVGDIADFSSAAPYAGIAAEAEVFPLANWPSLLRGVGLTLGYQRGFAKTTVQVSSPVGETPEREVYATDTAFGAMLAYRYFFDLGKTGAPSWGYGGIRLGALGRSFDVDETVEAPLPVTHRFYPAVGLDVSVPLLRAVRIESSGQLFLRPNPGQSIGDEDGSHIAEVRDYGQTVSSLGWAAELGVAGDIWGPLGYSARFRLEHYLDRFEGTGTRRGWFAGGIAEDTFSSILAGVTASW
jgi:outer membrane biosynthesis protein TonB